MRCVLVAVGSKGDATPFLVLARRLAAHGHEVALVSHAPLLPSQADGVTLVPADSDPAALLTGPAGRALRRWDLRGLNRTRGEFARFVSSVVAPTEEVVGGADVVVASTFATAAVPVARRAGVPVLRAHLWPEGVGLDGPMPVAPGSWLAPAGARRAARRGLRRMEPLLAGFDGWWESGRLHVVPHHPAGFTTTDLGSLHAYPGVLAGADAAGTTCRPGRPGWTCVTGAWADQTPRPLSERTTSLLAEGDPRIFVGFGSMHQQTPGRLLATVDDACLRAGTRAVVQLPGVAAGRHSSRVDVIGAEPHDALLPRCAAAVHHGGSGTTAAVVRAGIPSVVVPHIADQFYWGHRLRELGVSGGTLPRPLLTARGLATSLDAALAPATVARARALGLETRDEDGTGRAVAAVEEALAAAQLVRRS